MAFHEVRFPDDIAYGSSGGPGFSTSIVTLDSGAESRSPRWSSPRHRYNAAYGVRDQDQVDNLKGFYLARLGATHGFRFKDFGDFSTGADGVGAASPTDVVALSAAQDGSTFQLVKKYQSGPTTFVRRITKPVQGTVRVAVNGVERLSGVSVDSTTGVVTLAPGYESGDVVTWGGQFDVPVRFALDSDEVLSFTIDDYSNRSASVPLLEIKDGLVSPEEFNFGGAAEHAMAGDVSIGFGTGRVHVLAPQSSGLAVHLPDPDLVDPLCGGPFFALFNDGPTHSVAVKDEAGSTLVALAAGSSVELCITRDAGGSAWWYAR